jgi:hypothetical protein
VVKVTGLPGWLLEGSHPLPVGLSSYCNLVDVSFNTCTAGGLSMAGTKTRCKNSREQPTSLANVGTNFARASLRTRERLMEEPARIFPSWGSQSSTCVRVMAGWAVKGQASQVLLSIFKHVGNLGSPTIISRALTICAQYVLFYMPALLYVLVLNHHCVCY